MWLKDFLVVDKIKISFAKNFERHDKSKPLFFFVHGFLGAKEDWQKVCNLFGDRINAVAIDLPGYGESDKPKENNFYQEYFLVEVINSFIQLFECERKILVGYSMGGRAALSFAVKHSDLISALVLESVSPGIENAIEKANRIKHDNQLCEMISTLGLKKFIEYWDSQPLFASQKKLSPEILYLQNGSRMKNDTNSLILTLKNFGTGAMTSHWQTLSEIKIPIQLLSGELDNKFTASNERMNSIFPSAKNINVKDCGHNIHLENPAEFVNLINDFIKYL